MKNRSKPRKKHIPQYFKKSSSASLSQCLKIANYKKRINDLVRNNRHLAVELQEARCEVSSQSKILREYYTRDSNNIMRAQLKIRDMVKTINTLVCDIDEVKKFLDIDWTAIKGKLMQNRYTSDSKIIKVPEFEGIEEVSISAPETAILPREELPSSSQSSQSTAEQILLDKSYDKETILSDTSESPSSSGTNCILRSNEVTSPPVENEMPVVLFIEESGDQNTKNKRSTKSNKEKSDGSLTPELDIDFTVYRRKKSSSRRQTLFCSSSSKTSKSSGRVASYEQADPFEIQCENRPTGSSIIQGSKLPQSPHEKSQEQSGKCTSLSDSSVGTPYISNNVANCINDQVTSLAVFSLENASSVPPQIEIVPQQIESNHTLLLNEDMELTEVVNSCNTLLAGNNISTADNPGIDQRVVSDTCSEDTKNEIDKNENVDIKEVCKLNKEIIGINSADEQPSFSSKEISFREDIMTDQNNRRNRKSAQKDSASSLYGVKSRHKTVRKYLIFSSDESDSDYTPSKQTVRKRKCKDRDTAIFVANADSKKTVTENIEDCFSQQKHSFQNENKSKPDDLSVFSFSASFSEKSDKHVKKKTSKLSRNKRSDKGKELLAKPLSQTCNVTKFKGFNLKFSKSEYIDKKNKPGNIVLPERPKVPSGSESSASSNNGMEKEILTIESNVNKEKFPSSDKNTEQNEMSTESKCNTSFTDFGSLLSPRTILKNRNLNQGRKSEAKRVSFNSSDLICNFTKTSLSKTIAHNTKVWQTSKSVVDFEKILPPFEKQEECQEMPHDGILSDRNAANASVNAQESLFEDSDETELYKFSYPLTGGSSFVFADDDLKVSQKIVSSFDELPNNKSVPCHGKHNSDKNDVLIENTNKITVSSDAKDNLPKKNVVKKKSSMGNKIMQMKNATSSALKRHKETSQKKSQSSSKENIENNPKINKASRHRSPKILEMLSFNDSCLSEITVDNSCPKNKGSKVSVRKSTLPEKDKVLSSGKQKKNNSVKKHVQSTPVLKETMNLNSSFSLSPKTSLTKPQTEETLEKEIEELLPKRRSKPISYKEPSLNKKLRRNT